MHSPKILCISEVFCCTTVRVLDIMKLCRMITIIKKNISSSNDKKTKKKLLALLGWLQRKNTSGAMIKWSLFLIAPQIREFDRKRPNQDLKGFQCLNGSNASGPRTRYHRRWKITQSRPSHRYCCSWWP